MSSWYDIDSEFKLMSCNFSHGPKLTYETSYIYKNVLHRPAMLETIVSMYEINQQN